MMGSLHNYSQQQLEHIVRVSFALQSTVDQNLEKIMLYHGQWLNCLSLNSLASFTYTHTLYCDA